MAITSNYKHYLSVLNRNKPFKYFVSGFTAFLVDTLVLNLVIFFVFGEEGTPLFGIITVPKLISGTVGIIVSFNLNRNWTFDAKAKPKFKQGIKMAWSYLLSIILGAILITFYSDLIQEVLKLNEVLFPTIANVLTTASIMVLNYFIYKNFVFK